MNEVDDIMKKFNESITAELQLCMPAETPYLCAQLKEPGNYDKIRQLVKDKVLREQIDISQAIAAIEDELNPNSLD